jgi:glycosyltransferase involved in cell wall biosynthesis
MKITLIGCPFRTSYGGYISSLRSAIERATGTPVRWVASNCGCGDPIEVARRFETQDCDYFELPTKIGHWDIVKYSCNRNPLKRCLKSGLRYANSRFRALRFANLASQSDLIHFHQTLNAYGADVAFHFLRRNMAAARVMTLHELNPEQTDFPARNQTYNLADAIIVHDSLIKEELISMGVAADLVNVVCCGTDLAEGENLARDGIVFYGGHHLTENKGLGVLLQAYRCLKDRMPALPRLRIHGHYGVAPPPKAVELARQAGVADDVEWLNNLPEGNSSTDEMARLYRRSQVCVLPYKGSFGGQAAGVAAANRLPIIATRMAGVPDHIGDLGIWISGHDPRELADRIEQVLSDVAMRQDYAARLRAHAERHLGWDTVARQTLQIYQSAAERAAERLRCGTVAVPVTSCQAPPLVGVHEQ